MTTKTPVVATSQMIDDGNAPWQKVEIDGATATRGRSELDKIRAVTHITDVKVLTELIDCGIRADSLHILTLVPLVHVAWANGKIEYEERIAILEAATQAGLNPESPGYALLNGWLCCRPDRSLIRTWKDYVGALRRFISFDSFEILHLQTIKHARTIAEAAGGLLGVLKVSRSEEAAIQELNNAFFH